MKLTQEDFLQLKQQHEEAAAAAERAKGALQQLLVQLHKQFACDLKSARRLLKQLQEEQTKTEKLLKDSMNEYIRLRDRG